MDLHLNNLFDRFQEQLGPTSREKKKKKATKTNQTKRRQMGDRRGTTSDKKETYKQVNDQIPSSRTMGTIDK
jgi:hypothetical protein